MTSGANAKVVAPAVSKAPTAAASLTPAYASSSGPAPAAASPAKAATTLPTAGSGFLADDSNEDSAKDRPAQLKKALLRLKIVVPIKNVLSCLVLCPVLWGGACKPERFCLPWVNAMFLLTDIAAFTGHVVLGIKRSAYYEQLLSFNFYVLGVAWTFWNLFSHPFFRQHAIELFAAGEEIHVGVNIAAMILCSNIMAPPSLQHLVGLVVFEFLISTLIYGVDFVSTAFEINWLSIARLNIVTFNASVVLIACTIVFTTMMVEKDIKNLRSLAKEMDEKIVSGSFESELDRRKRAVLTALCDAVLTTDASYVIQESGGASDPIFRKSMKNEQLTDYFKDAAEKERFIQAIQKQFPQDGSAGEGPKRMRFTLRDNHDEFFEADVVVSDAGTGKDGKILRYMVGMHLRGEYRARIFDESRWRKNRPSPAAPPAEKRPPAETFVNSGPLEKILASRRASELRAAESTTDAQAAARAAATKAACAEFNRALLGVFERVLETTCSGQEAESSVPTSSSTPDVEGPGATKETPSFPRVHLRRSTCEMFKRRGGTALRSGGVTLDHHLDLRRLSLPAAPFGGTF